MAGGRKQKKIEAVESVAPVREEPAGEPGGGERESLELNERFINPRAIHILQSVLDLGRNRGKSGWQDEPVELHVQHALEHIAKWQSGEREKWEAGESKERENHLAHAFCRLMMANLVSEKRTMPSGDTAEWTEEQATDACIALMEAHDYYNGLYDYYAGIISGLEETLMVLVGNWDGEPEEGCGRS
jgi:hypothetical protein